MPESGSLDIRGLRKAWPGFALSVDLPLGEGEIGAILGPSGCGKSSLLRLVAGLEEPDGGSIRLRGRELVGLAPERRGLGMVFQDYALFPHLDVSRNIEYGPRLGGAGRAERERLAATLAISLGIAALLRRRPATLSGGERQRVALARSLAAAPGLLLLDEPLSSLDAGMRRQLRAEIAARLRALSLPALYVTHDVEEALAVADRLFVMDRGTIVEGGRPEEIYEAPRRAVTASFLGLGPVLPVLGLQGAEDRLSVLTALGPLDAGGPLPEGDEASEALSVFFHADAAMPAPAGTVGALVGRVLSSDFLGRRRRVALLCPLRNQGAGALTDGSALGLRIEIDIPASHRPVPGEILWFTLPPGSCRLLAGRLDHPR